MQDKIKDTIHQIEQLEMTVNGLDEFEIAINNLINWGKTDMGIQAIFHAFEKYPEETANGLFWTALHAIETTSDYYNDLIASLTRKPSIMTISMARRIMNNNDIYSDQFKTILDQIASNENHSSTIRELAR